MLKSKAANDINLRPYRTLGLPLLALMGLIGLAGVLLTVAFNYWL